MTPLFDREIMRRSPRRALQHHMSNLFERASKVAKAEWSALVRRRTDDASAELPDRVDHVPVRLHAALDISGALAVLALPPRPEPTLDEVRARYRSLAQKHQPKTQSAAPEEASSAHALMQTLTEALEVLEAHLLPLPR